MLEPNHKMRLLEETLETMIAENEKITARAVIARMDGVLKHASDITRNAARRELFSEYKKKQVIFRDALGKSFGKSSRSLAKENAVLTKEIETLRQDRELLIASHRAAILAVGEIGGISAWLKFFEQYKSTVDHLGSLGAVPFDKLS